MAYIAAVNKITGEIVYGGSSGSGYDVEPGLSPTQVRRVYNRRPDPRTEKDDGIGNLISKTQIEINAYDTKIRRLKFERIATLASNDVDRLQWRAIWRIAKAAGLIPVNTGFLAFLRRVADDK